MSEITRTVLLDNGDVKIGALKYSVRVVSGPNVGLTQVSAGRQLEIGSAPDNGFGVGDPPVTRSHAVAEVDGGYRLRDKDSKNGTLVNGMRISSVFLEDGTTFRVGDTECEFKLRSEEVEIRYSGKDRFGSML